MSLELTRKNYYFYPVSGTTLTEDGTKRPFDFRAKFARLGSERLTELFNPVPDPVTGATKVAADLEVAREVLIGWEGVRIDGQEVAFTPELLEDLLDDHHVLAAVIRSFMASLKDGLGKSSPMRRHG